MSPGNAELLDPAVEDVDVFVTDTTGTAKVSGWMLDAMRQAGLDPTARELQPLNEDEVEQLAAAD